MLTDDIVEKYRLSPEEHDAILSDIFELSLEDIPARQTPKIVILGGQPGCGKSVVIAKHLQDTFLDENSVCIINGDELRRYHPRSDEIFAEYEQLYADITDLDVRSWTSALFDAAIQKRVDIVFEGTMRNDAVCETIKRLYSEGYNIVISPIAASYKLSLFSVCMRFYLQKKDTGHGRSVSFESHREAYNKMPVTLQKIIDEHSFERIEAYGRVPVTNEYIALAVDEKDVVSEILLFRDRKESEDIENAFNAAIRALVFKLRRIGENSMATVLGKHVRKSYEYNNKRSRI